MNEGYIELTSKMFNNSNLSMDEIKAINMIFSEVKVSKKISLDEFIAMNNINQNDKIKFEKLKQRFKMLD